MEYFNFGTKAETLEKLSVADISPIIPRLYYFTVEDWRTKSDRILGDIAAKFTPAAMVVRSSSWVEDGKESSMAGAFKSKLSVDSNDQTKIVAAIDEVIQSYPYQNPRDQILIQPMIENVVVSGVILTRCLDDGAPYYILNYDDESGTTDSVTGGVGVHKTVFVYRQFEEDQFDSIRVRRMVHFTTEIEKICGQIPLDIEFSIDREDRLYLFQVRRITTVEKWSPEIEESINRSITALSGDLTHRLSPRLGIYGRRTIFTNMSDWNPAELIGVTPRPLSSSMFRTVITKDLWRIARQNMGYRMLPEEELMVIIGGRPYIDVRNSFNSFLPNGLGKKIGEQLVNAWLDRLDDHPELHDKVEFEVAQTIYDFSFHANNNAWYPNLLNSHESEQFHGALKHLTRASLDQTKTGSLPTALRDIGRLSEVHKTRGAISFERRTVDNIQVLVKTLLEECRQLGTLPFSIIARHGFIAETLLRSAQQRGAISHERLQAFKQSLQTITHDLTVDLSSVHESRMHKDEFLDRYGHLRPSSYDICSMRYSDRDDLFNELFVSNRELGEPFMLTTAERRDINALLKETGLDVLNAHQLVAYANRAIVGREYAKFVFTKNLSDALEGIAHWGRHYDLDRDDLSYLSLPNIIETADQSKKGSSKQHLSDLIDASRHQAGLDQSLRMSYIIRDVRDLAVVPIHRAAPNFVTHRKTTGYVQYLDASSLSHGNLYRKIVCIESADPGFDWIFAKGILGLITKFGGANSHMAIRCAELGLPAAIGCGEMLFENIISANTIELNCAEKRIRFLHES